MNRRLPLSGSHPRIAPILLIILALGILLRILFPLADPPRNLTISGAPVGDPGQHSYGARNCILFGQWSFDEWKPHLGSPLISMGLNWLTFRIFGVGFAAHKSIPIFFSILTLLAFLLLVYRRLPARAMSAAVLFAACSFPLLMYAHVGNRYMPMIFFFLLSMHFFIRGAETGRSGKMALAAIFFLLSYASQNHILYMAGVLVCVSGFWLLRGRLKLAAILTFWGIFSAGMTAWYLIIFLPNRDFFASFVGHNRLVRYIQDLPHLLSNIRLNPFALQFRNDAPVLFLATLGVGIAAAFWIRKSRLSPLMEVALIWLVLAAGFHSIWSYRPTRFYLVILFPVAVIAAWLLEKLVERKRAGPTPAELAIACFAMAIALLVSGGVVYVRYALQRVHQQPLMLIAYASVLMLTGVLLWAPKKWREWARAAFLALAVTVNTVTYIQWALQREYRIIETADVLTRALPPTRIAGNWASILSLGGPHQTHLLSGEMGINWHPDFFSANQVEYLLLTKGAFANEYREYMRLFPQQMATARLMARFPIYSAETQLWKLCKSGKKAPELEMESITQRPARVAFDPLASAKMTLALPAGSRIKLSIPCDFVTHTSAMLELRARGRFHMHVVLNNEGSILRRNLLIWNSTEFGSRRVLNRPIPRSATLEFQIDVGRSMAYLDLLRVIQMN